MKLGATDIADIKLGTVGIAKVMFGADEVWSATLPEPIIITTGDDPATVVANSPAGSTFVFEAGVYRITQTIVPRNGDTFIGASDHATVLNGSRLLTTWTQDGGVWKATGQTQAGEVHGQCDTDHPRCGYPEELFIDDVRQKHVATAGEVGPGTWHFDYPNDTIIIGENPAGKKVETSVTTYAFRSANNNVTIKGVVIEKFANLAQRGVIYPEQPLGTVGEGWVVEDCIIRNNHGAGLSPRDGGVVRNCLITQNGQIGMSAVGADILIEDNEISYNNAARFEYGWEGGGAKFVNTTNLIVRGNYSHHNYGPGLWTDIDNVDSLYEDNIVEDNFDTGIFHEISYDAIIRNNTIRRNGLGRGLAEYAWAFGAGIAIYNSSNVEVYGNTLEGNHGGITCISHPRGSGAYGDWHLKNISIHDNEVQLLYHENGINWDSNPGVYAHNGVFQDNSPTDVFDPAANIVFAANAYTTSPGRIAGAYFGWLNGFRTFTQWTTTYSQDAGATIEEMPPEALSYDEWLKSLNPIAFFRMADAGTTMVDEMGNITTGAHDAANLAAAPIPTSAGAHAYLGDADAKSSHFTSTADLEAAEFTTALWFRFPTGAATERSVLNAHNSAFTRGHGIWLNASNGGSLDFYRGNGSGVNPIPGGIVPRNTPLRIVCVHQGSTSRIYVNGVESSNGTITYSPVPTGTLIEIGSEEGGSYINGLIWDVAFFDYAWDAATVEEDYERGTEGMA